MTTPAVEEKTPPSDTNRPVGEDRRATDKEEETSAVQRRTTDTPFERSAALIGTSVSSGDLESPKLGVVVPTEKELAQQQESLQLQTLARQLEYYFSKQNLATDTYLQTLRDLNDGCVPVTILANFCKVKAILKTTTTPEQQHQKKTSAQHKSSLLLQEEELRMHAILQAVNEYYTDLLQVHSIDTATGKIATDDTPSSAITILAVGPVVRSSNTANATATTAVSKELQSPGSITALVAASSPSSSSLEQQPPPAVVADYSNMIILRDVDAVVTDAEVRGLFDDIEECPPVVSVVSDVANSWFIMLDTSDRSDMMRILMQLRGKTYPSTGDYVMARIRASIVTHSMVDVYSTLPTADAWDNAAVQQLPKKKKKKKRRTKSVKTKSASKATLSNSILVATKPPPPLLTEDHFPSLLDDKVEWATTPVEADDSVGEREDDESEESTKHDGGEDEEERKSAKALSDAASTATTTSSNVSSGGFDSVSKKQAVGDYAAALLKAPASKTTVPAVAVRETQAPKPRKPSSSDSDEKMAPDPVVITSPLTWGGGRSFADMLRKKDAQSQREKQ